MIRRRLPLLAAAAGVLLFCLWWAQCGPRIPPPAVAPHLLIELPRITSRHEVKRVLHGQHTAAQQVLGTDAINGSTNLGLEFGDTLIRQNERRAIEVHPGRLGAGRVDQMRGRAEHGSSTSVG